MLGGSELRAMLDLEQQKTALGCNDTSCLAELGGSLGVPFLVVPTIGKLGGSYLLNIKLFDVDESEPLWRDRRQVDSEVGLLPAMKELAEALHRFRHQPAAPSPVTAAATTRWAPMAVTALGGLVATSATLHFVAAKERYQRDRSSANYDAAEAARSVDLPAALGGAAIAVAGALWLTMP